MSKTFNTNPNKIQKNKFESLLNFHLTSPCQCCGLVRPFSVVGLQLFLQELKLFDSALVDLNKQKNY